MKNNTVKVIVFVLVFAVSFILGKALMGGFDNEAKERTYSSDGFTITMEDDFYEKELLTATVYYEGEKSALSVTREYFTDLEEIGINANSSLNDYGKLITTVNGIDNNFKILNDSITYYTYDKSISGKDFSYMVAITKGSDSFWLINLFCETKNKDTYFPKFEKWLQTVKVD